ncbi:MAG TPA: glucose-6-phosphate dehydrogenase [Myxococcaceae bacterium]|nr:glucose-6-phosphate dehydrogenase [Myxococcaceae bacterium]
MDSAAVLPEYHSLPLPSAQLQPCTLVLLGASGDLARRKLVPALFRLEQAGQLPRDTTIIGAALPGMNPQEFRATMRETVVRAAGAAKPAAWHAFSRRLHYLPLDVRSAGDFRHLGTLIDQVERARATGGNRLFYLSLAPSLHPYAVRALGETALARAPHAGWARLVVEKPFGTDLSSARELNQLILRCFDESSVYRMDHYLGKEMVQNLLFLRFANRMFEPLWSREHIEHVRITCAETTGVEGRGGYYEQAGAVRDMIQNHALQLLALVAMDAPRNFSARSVHEAKEALMAQLRPFTPERVRAECVRGQYGPGRVEGQRVRGYREEDGVASDSSTETFALLTFRIDNPRWAGVPFYVGSGKRLARRSTEIVLQLRPGPLSADGSGDGGVNQLVFHIQPDEGVSLRFATKAPGHKARLLPASADFRCGDVPGGARDEAYEHLLMDCMQGASANFVTEKMVEHAWRLVTPVLDAWAAAPSAGFPNYAYAAGSAGPEAAARLLTRHRRR